MTPSMSYKSWAVFLEQSSYHIIKTNSTKAKVKVDMCGVYFMIIKGRKFDLGNFRKL